MDRYRYNEDIPIGTVYRYRYNEDIPIGIMYRYGYNEDIPIGIMYRYGYDGTEPIATSTMLTASSTTQHLIVCLFGITLLAV